MNDHHVLITQLCDELDHNRRCLLDDRRVTHPLADRARAVLAADGPAVPEGREPASVMGEPSDAELLELMPELMRDEFSYAAQVCSDATGGQATPVLFRACLNTAALEFARAALDRFGHQPAPPAAGEVAELVALLTLGGDAAGAKLTPEHCRRIARLLQQCCSYDDYILGQ